MYWGYISASGTACLIKYPDRLNSVGYLNVLEEACIPLNSDFGCKFMDDNAPVHRATAVSEWKNDKGIVCIDWPPRSPDLNPIKKSRDS